MADVVATPGWLASTGKPFGQDLTLTLLAAGLLVGTADGDPEAFYTEVAAAGTAGVRDILTGVFTDTAETYPYLTDAIAPLTGWLVDAPPARLASAGDLARILADIDLKETARTAGGDLAGQVYDEILAISRRSSRTLELFTIEQCVAAALLQLPHIAAMIERGGRWLDGFCASGVRFIGALIVARAADLDMTKVTLVLNDPDPVMVALAAVNLACYHHPGPVELVVSPGLINRDESTVGRMLLADPAAGGPWGVTPAGWIGRDYEEARAVRDELDYYVDTAVDAIHAAAILHARGVCFGEIGVGDLIEYDPGAVDDGKVDYGPRRATRSRTVRKKPRRKR